jgi:hypothetical protein
MKDQVEIQKAFMEGVSKEQTLRTQIVTGIVRLLKDPKTEFKFKFCIVMVLLIMFALSLVFCLFIINASIVIFRPEPPLNVVLYLSIIFGKVVLMMAVGMPLVFKASTVEQAARLDDSFNKIHRAKFGH